MGQKAYKTKPRSSVAKSDPGQQEAGQGFRRSRMVKVVLPVACLVVLVVAIAFSMQDDFSLGHQPTDDDGSEVVEVNFQGDRSTWQLLAMSDKELEKVSLVELNLAVVREIPGYEDLDIAKYEKIVDRWTREFADELPTIDATFRGREDQFNNDLRFYRIGQLMAWLGYKKGIEYIPEQRDVDAVIYKDPGELFLHGLLNTNQGTCGNMPMLQAAIARRLGWPVSLAPVESHTVCRYDDGEVVYNIETTHTDKGGFSAGTEQDYIKEFHLPPCALSKADTLETMTARQMLGYFIGLRARYYRDTGEWEKADQDYALARSLLPRHRKLLLASLEISLQRGNTIFDARERQHPFALFAGVGRMYETQQQRQKRELQEMLVEIDRMNAENHRRLDAYSQQDEQWHDPYRDPWGPSGGVHQPGVPNPNPDPYQSQPFPPQ